jgi:hypothetical protein
VAESEIDRTSLGIDTPRIFRIPPRLSAIFCALTFIAVVAWGVKMPRSRRYREDVLTKQDLYLRQS